jgi:hypothetical protein
MFQILGWIFLFLLVFVLGCMRGEYMTLDKAIKAANDKTVFTKTKEGKKIYCEIKDE